jgi:hypothetical protein
LLDASGVPIGGIWSSTRDRGIGVAFRAAGGCADVPAIKARVFLSSAAEHSKKKELLLPIREGAQLEEVRL